MYCRYATLCPVSAGARQESASASGTVSVVIHSKAASSGARCKKPRAASATAAVHTTALTPASLAMAWSLGSVRCRRVGSGGYAGTATTPAKSAPKKPAR